MLGLRGLGQEEGVICPFAPPLTPAPWKGRWGSRLILGHILSPPTPFPSGASTFRARGWEIQGRKFILADSPVVETSAPILLRFSVVPPTALSTKTACVSLRYCSASPQPLLTSAQTERHLTWTGDYNPTLELRRSFLWSYRHR